MNRMRDRHDTKLYYSISEASAIAKVKPHVLRYWETQFKMLRPKKNKAGNRMYRRRDLRLIQMIKELLYDKGFTIAGARRKLLDERTLIRDQLELFTEAERSRMMGEIIQDLKSLVRELRGIRELVKEDSLANGDGLSDADSGPAGDPEEEALAAGFTDEGGSDEPDADGPLTGGLEDGYLPDEEQDAAPGSTRLGAEE